jgi:hypothetical protein
MVLCLAHTITQRLSTKSAQGQECGNVNISLDALARLAKALGVRVKDLVAEV